MLELFELPLPADSPSLFPNPPLSPFDIVLASPLLRAPNRIGDCRCELGGSPFDFKDEFPVLGEDRARLLVLKSRHCSVSKSNDELEAELDEDEELPLRTIVEPNDV